MRTKNITVGRSCRNNSWYNQKEETDDYVYLLSEEEFKRYEMFFINNESMNLRTCFATDYAVFGKGLPNEKWDWYLRSGSKLGVAIVCENAIEYYQADAYDGDYPCAVRPVIRIRLDE